MRFNSSNKFAKPRSMQEVNECLKCGSDKLNKGNFSICENCGFEQSLKLPVWGNMESGYFTGFQCHKSKEQEESL